MDENFIEMKISSSDDNYINKSYIKVNKSSFAYPDSPDQFTSNEDSIRKITFRFLVLIFAVCGNLLILAILVKNRHKKSRVYGMLLHLIISDLIVAFVTIPIEMSGMISVQWKASSAACKIMFYLTAFGSYLSSTVGTCISLDKYFVVVHPLKFINAQRRSKIMLGAAWVISITCSIPQSIIFHVEDDLEFLHCGSFNFFPTLHYKFAYDIFYIITVYAAPSSIIIFCNFSVLRVMCKRFRKLSADLTQEYRRCFYHRRGRIAITKRARASIRQMAFTTVLTFFLFWIPFLAMILWYVFHPVSAERMDSSVLSYFFIFPVFNLILNPFIYGIYVLNFKLTFRLCSKTRTSTRINRLQFVDASHLKVAVKSTMNSSISCPALLQDLKVDDSGPMAGVWKCHCSCSGSKIKDMHISGISRKAELVTRSLDHLENISRTFSTL